MRYGATVVLFLAFAVYARAADERSQTLALRAERERDAAGQVGFPHRRRRIAHRAGDPEIPALDLGEIAREIRDDRDGYVLNSAGGGTADGWGHVR